MLLTLLTDALVKLWGYLRQEVEEFEEFNLKTLKFYRNVRFKYAFELFILYVLPAYLQKLLHLKLPVFICINSV